MPHRRESRGPRRSSARAPATGRAASPDSAAIRAKAHQHERDATGSAPPSPNNTRQPSVEHLPSEQRTERAAERHAAIVSVTASGRCRRGMLRCERRRVGKRATQSEPGQEPQHPERHERVGGGDGDRRQREHQHAPDQGDRRQDGRRPCQPPRRQSSCRPFRTRGSARTPPVDRPFPHHRRDGHAEQLVVEPVEDDRQRGQQDNDALVRCPATLVEEPTDVERRGGPCVSFHASERTQDSAESVRSCYDSTAQKEIKWLRRLPERPTQRS